jgi:hypothetical protein
VAVVRRAADPRAVVVQLEVDKPGPQGRLAAVCKAQRAAAARAAQVAKRAAVLRQTAPERQAAVVRQEPGAFHQQAAQQAAVLQVVVVQVAKAVLRAAVHPRAALAAKVVEPLRAVVAVVVVR